jgi:hypothetical protein
MKLGIIWSALGSFGVFWYIHVQSTPANILMRPLPVSPGNSTIVWDTTVIQQPWYGGAIWLVIGIILFICGIIRMVKWGKNKKALGNDCILKAE